MPAQIRLQLFSRGNIDQRPRVMKALPERRNKAGEGGGGVGGGGLLIGVICIGGSVCGRHCPVSY